MPLYHGRRQALVSIPACSIDIRWQRSTEPIPAEKLVLTREDIASLLNAIGKYNEKLAVCELFSWKLVLWSNSEVVTSIWRFYGRLQVLHELSVYFFSLL